MFQKLSPALLKELPHVMTSSTNVWIVFIEFFTVIKDQVDIDDERLQVLIPEILKKKEDIFRLERTADTSHNSWKKLNKTENTGLALTSVRGF